MTPEDPSSSEEDERSGPADSWWAVLARRLLHRVQVEAIEAMQQSKEPMSARELSDIIEGTRPGYLAQHHLRRLRKLGAIEHAGRQASRSSVDTPYRLVWELNDAGR